MIMRPKLNSFGKEYGLIDLKTSIYLMGAKRKATCILQRRPKVLLLSVAKNLSLFLNLDTVTSILLTAQKSACTVRSSKSELPNTAMVLFRRSSF